MKQIRKDSWDPNGELQYGVIKVKDYLKFPFMDNYGHIDGDLLFSEDFGEWIKLVRVEGELEGMDFNLAIAFRNPLDPNVNVWVLLKNNRYYSFYNFTAGTHIPSNFTFGEVNFDWGTNTKYADLQDVYDTPDYIFQSSDWERYKQVILEHGSNDMKGLLLGLESYFPGRSGRFPDVKEIEFLVEAMNNKPTGGSPILLSSEGEYMVIPTMSQDSNTLKPLWAVLYVPSDSNQVALGVTSNEADIVSLPFMIYAIEYGEFDFGLFKQRDH